MLINIFHRMLSFLFIYCTAKRLAVQLREPHTTKRKTAIFLCAAVGIFTILYQHSETAYAIKILQFKTTSHNISVSLRPYTPLFLYHTVYLMLWQVFRLEDIFGLDQVKNFVRYPNSTSSYIIHPIFPPQHVPVPRYHFICTAKSFCSISISTHRFSIFSTGLYGSMIFCLLPYHFTIPIKKIYWVGKPSGHSLHNIIDFIAFSSKK